MRLTLIFLSLFFLHSSSFGFAMQEVDQIQSDEEAVSETSLNVFIDCKTRGCDFDYFRRELPYLNYVRNRQDADLHILITSQRSGSGGQLFSLDIIGLKAYLNNNLSLNYESGPTATDDDIRSGLLLRIKSAMIPYMINRRSIESLDIVFENDLDFVNTPVIDPWNLWVFRINVNGDVELEQQSKGRQFETELEANRTSEDVKMDFEIEVSYEREDFEVSDGTIKDVQWENSFNNMIVFSVNDHWSVGGYGSIRNSTFNNYKLQAEIMPAVEYNLFPYFESSRKQLLFMYRVGPDYFSYREETIFDKTEELLFSQALNIALEVNQPWGDIRARAEASTYLHDLSKNRVDIFTRIEVNLFRGFAVNVRSSYSMIRDQLNLTKGGASRDDILLRRRELATNYEFEFSAGISYTFGSVSNNIVNPRFGF